MPFFDIFAAPRWSPLRMRTKVVSFFIFSKSFQKQKVKALRPKMTKTASRRSCLKGFCHFVMKRHVEKTGIRYWTKVCEKLAFIAPSGHRPRGSTDGYQVYVCAEQMSNCGSLCASWRKFLYRLHVCNFHKSILQCVVENVLIKITHRSLS